MVTLWLRACLCTRLMILMMMYRFGRRVSVFVFALIRLVGLVIATTLASSYVACVLARFVLGFGFGGCRVAIYVLSTQYCSHLTLHGATVFTWRQHGVLCKRCISCDRDVCLSVRLSVCLSVTRWH